MIINDLFNNKKTAVAEGAKWRSDPDAYDVDDEGNKTPRNPNTPKFGYDPLQRRADTANDAKTPRGKTAALKTSLKMAKGNKGVAEVSKATLDRYVPKAVDAHGHADFGARQNKDDPTLRSYHKSQKHTAEKRRQGISRALDRMSKTEGVAENMADDMAAMAKKKFPTAYISKDGQEVQKPENWGKKYVPLAAAPADLEKQQRELTAKYPNIDELVRRAELNRDPDYEMADGQAYYAARDAEQNYQKLRQIQRVIQGLNESLNRSHLP